MGVIRGQLGRWVMVAATVAACGWQGLVIETAASGAEPPGSADATAPFVPGVVLVGLRPPAAAASGRIAAESVPAAGELARQWDVVTAEPLFPSGPPARVASALGAPAPAEAAAHVYRARLQAAESVAAAVARLRQLRDVAYAEPDYVAHILATPTDPLYPDQWGLARIEAPAAWDLQTGLATVPIAIVDSGMDVTHPDLASQLWRNSGEVAANGLDDDGNGHVDDLNGWNVFGGNADLSDTTGHGTEVAGIVAAASNNAAGVQASAGAAG
jgi:subtilisin family serine protease